MYLVTGGAGFIGSHLVETLVRRGEQVRVLDDFSSGSWANLAPFSDAIEIIEGDVADLPTVRKAMTGVTHVLHHAAIASVAKSVSDPLTVHRVNVDGTLNVLLAAREQDVQRLVFASSAAIYGLDDCLPLGENVPPQPISPYAASKAAGEVYVQAFCSSYNLPSVVLRYFNVFGPRQDPNSPYSGVISKFIAAMRQKEAPTVFGDGRQTRDFIFVKDVVQANLAACTRPNAVGKIINVATGRRTSVLRLVEAINELIGAQLIASFAPPRPAEVRHSQADVAVAREILGWQSKIGLETGLAETFSWMEQVALAH